MQFESAIPILFPEEKLKKTTIVSDQLVSDRLGKDRIIKKVTSKEKNRNQKRVSPNFVKQNDQSQKAVMDTKYEFLFERVRDLESKSQEMEKAYTHTVSSLKSDLKAREEKTAGVKADIELIKKDLAERRKDIIQLIGMIKDLGIGQPTEASSMPLIKHQSEPGILEPVGSERDTKTEKIKKTSNEKGKKVSSPGKKSGFQLKERSPNGKAIGKV